MSQQPAQPARKVTFAPAPVVYSSVPWLEAAKLEDVATDLKYSDSPLYPVESSLKRKFGPLRPTVDGPPSKLGYLFIVAGLLFLFFVIWWLADKLLMLEIEEQVRNIHNGFNK